jgi:hypothetical protein
MDAYMCRISPLLVGPMDGLEEVVFAIVPFASCFISVLVLVLRPCSLRGPRGVARASVLGAKREVDPAQRTVNRGAASRGGGTRIPVEVALRHMLLVAMMMPSSSPALALPMYMSHQNKVQHARLNERILVARWLASSLGYTDRILDRRVKIICTS